MQSLHGSVGGSERSVPAHEGRRWVALDWGCEQVVPAEVEGVPVPVTDRVAVWRVHDEASDTLRVERATADPHGLA